MKTYPKVCENCHTAYEAKKPHGRFCSDNCRRQLFNDSKVRDFFIEVVRFFRRQGMSYDGMIRYIKEVRDE
jgi:protein-arginine kinase activator protein McsA